NADFRRWRSPRLESLALAETRYQSGVNSVGFPPQQFTLGERFDASWINHTHAHTLVMKMVRQRLPIRACRLHTDPHVTRMSVSQPSGELFKTILCVREDFLCLSAVTNQRSVKRFFGNIDPEERSHGAASNLGVYSGSTLCIRAHC